MNYRSHTSRQRNEDIVTAFTHSSDGMVISDCEGRMLMLNPAFRRVTGIQPKSALGYKTAELVQNGTLSDSAIVKVVKTGTTSTVRVTTAAKREVMSTARPIYDGGGKLVQVVCNLRNLWVFREANRAKSGAEHVPLTEEHGIVAKSPIMLDTLKIAAKLSRLDSNLLILGETGVGKDLVANYIYRKSDRSRTGSFIKVNCAAIPANLFESELFGYQRGAFTGALAKGKAGLIEMADQGVLFLNEIGELPLELQAKLLTVIEDRQVVPVGGLSARKVDVRIISATNSDLAQLVSQGRFREDLYYRLAVIPLYVPALRERPEDIRGLLMHFQEELSKKLGVKRTLSEQLCEFLCGYSWPGNVRELANLVEYLFATGSNETLEAGDLPRRYISDRTPLVNRRPAWSHGSPIALKELLATYELEIIRQAIKSTSSYSEAARLLKTSLSTINRKARLLKGLKVNLCGILTAHGLVSAITEVLSAL